MPLSPRYKFEELVLSYKDALKRELSRNGILNNGSTWQSIRYVGGTNKYIAGIILPYFEYTEHLDVFGDGVARLDTKAYLGEELSTRSEPEIGEIIQNFFDESDNNGEDFYTILDDDDNYSKIYDSSRGKYMVVTTKHNIMKQRWFMNWRDYSPEDFADELYYYALFISKSVSEDFNKFLSKVTG